MIDIKNMLEDELVILFYSYIIYVYLFIQYIYIYIYIIKCNQI